MHDEHPAGRESSELQIERGDRQKRRHHAGRREPVGAILVDEDQMIGRTRAQF